jgi:hypothetical protein
MRGLRQPNYNHRPKTGFELMTRGGEVLGGEKLPRNHAILHFL